MCDVYNGLDFPGKRPNDHENISVVAYFFSVMVGVLLVIRFLAGSCGYAVVTQSCGGA